MLKNSPYKDQLATPRLFIEALQDRVKEIPNLISPHLGDPLPDNWAVASTPAATPAASPAAAPAPATTDDKLIVALPLGGRVKMDPWNDELTMLKAKSVGILAEREKMPFEVTPFIPHLSREQSASVQAAAAPTAATQGTQSSANVGDAIDPIADPVAAGPAGDTK